ncbi:MAG: ATP-binding cassette domain-containing protein [Pseudonocardiales bacterium]
MIPETEAVVVATGLSLGYRNARVLHDTSLTVEAGAELAITGRSGSGKTTLLLVLAGLLQPENGTVRWPGLDPDPQRRRSQIGLVFQAPSLLPELTAAENVALPLRLSGHGRAAAASATEAALDAIGLSAAADAMPGQLSGGMQQRVAIARVLAGQPRLVLADEPTGALDRESAFTAVAALRDHTAGYGAALVVATHDDEIAALLHHQAVLEQGRLQVGAPS